MVSYRLSPSFLSSLFFLIFFLIVIVMYRVVLFVVKSLRMRLSAFQSLHSL